MNFYITSVTSAEAGFFTKTPLFREVAKKLFLKITLLIFIFSFLSCTRTDDAGIKYAPSQIDRSAPEFKLSTITGKQVTLSYYKGRVVLIQFWATWCPTCRTTIIELGPIYEKYKDKGFDILAISIDTGQDVKNKLSAFAEQHGMTYQVLIGDRKVASRYGVHAIPTSFLIDKEGKIKGYYLGFQPDFSSELRRKIGELL